MVAERARRGDIQGLRAVAVLAVVVFHVGVFAPHPLLPGGYVGVDVFFVISGYVITRGLVAQLDAGEGVRFGRFYARRVRRILPALALTLVVVIPASQWLGPVGGAEVTARTGAAASVSLANVYLIRSGGGGYFDETAELNSLLHTWSLSVEEQFYLVLPAGLALGWAIGRRRRAASARPGRVGRHHGTTGVVVVLAAGTVASLAASVVLTRPAGVTGDGLARLAFFSPFTRAWELGVGCLLAVVASRHRTLPRRLVTTAGVGGLALLGVAVVAFDDATPFPGTAALVPVAAAALLLAAGEREGSPVVRALAWRPLQAAGDRSYAWYLWHWPCIVFAAALWPRAPWAAAAGAVASLLPAELSHRLVEEPIRRRPLAGRRALAVGVVCAAVPLAVAVVVAADRVGMLRPADTIEAIDARFAHHADHQEGCSDSPGLGPGGEGACAFPVPDGTGAGRAVLVGDSNAGHLTEGFVAAAHALDLDAVVATHPSCPVAALVVGSGPERTGPCRDYVERTLATLESEPPEVVVVASASDLLLDDGAPELTLVPPATPSTDGGRRERYEEGLVAALGPVAAQSPVLVVHPTPRFPDWHARRCAVIRWRTDPAACAATSPVTDGAARRADALAAEEAAARRIEAGGGRARTLDPFPLLCPDDPCRTEVDGTWLFRDPTHLSIDGSLTLAGALRDAMATATAPPPGEPAASDG